MKAELATLRGRSERFDGIVGPALRHALTETADAALLKLFTTAIADGGETGIALLAVGGYGRGEPAPGTDLDLVLIHDGRRGNVAAIAEEIWYPVWDSGVKLDHSVRTIDEVIGVADTDLKAALGLLDARAIAGDRAFAATLLDEVRSRWRTRAARRLPELAAMVAERAERCGEVAFLLEPDLKEARGGLRDVHALRALATAWVAEAPSRRVLAAYRVLLDARGEVRRRSSSPGGADRMLLQEQTPVADARGYSDSLGLARAVADAGRTIAWTWDSTWYRVSAALRPPARWRRRRPERRPLDEGVVEQNGEVQLALAATPATDPVLPLRAGAAAARAGIPLGRYALERLAREAPPMPCPWPEGARDDLVGLLATGRASVTVLEALDQVGLLVRLLPEWEQVRSKPQRNPYHRFTVDRHLMEAAAAATGYTREVDRPDLLLLGALLHDLGKGWPGDHTEVGIKLVGEIAPRMGLNAEDTEVLAAMVRHHLLLPEAATRRDIDDPATIEAVARAVGSERVLTLLYALTRADSAATGPTAWSAWKARLVGELVERTAAALGGHGPATTPDLTERQRTLLAVEETLYVEANPLPDDGMFEIVVVADDQPALLAATTGVLALHRLDVRRASARGANGRALQQAAVSARRGETPSASRLRADLTAALAGRLDLSSRLAGREQAYANVKRWAEPAPPQVLFDDSSSMTVIEVRAPDGLGVLYRIVRALADADLDVSTAVVATLGLDVVDAFYVRDRDGTGPLTPERREQVSEAVLGTLAAPVGA
ncbi:MAG: [protein-PII] uridylyltransferase [Frankia sp.]